MEVAGQWRREWAGTAEYGNVTEGGVTRRVARAMEVMHASGPGSRVRVLRAAYHSTAGPGMPSESVMIHSSRRVISSGSKLLESPTFPSRPLEISSTPFNHLPTPDTFNETETNYKVTEPDDTEISEPSKWRSTNNSSARMPSEESSSTDNASIIDLDSRLHTKHTNLMRKYSFDSDSSDFQSKQSSKTSTSRTSPLLDTPVTLSTLKYKSLLNGTDTWHDRRKSYSFEDTSPLTETILHKNETLAMDSSTDSGICKSTEIVNDNSDDSINRKYTKREREETFKDWLAKNRYSKEPIFKQHKHNYILEEPAEDKISLQSNGKVSISLPMNNQLEDKFQYMKNHINGEMDRKVKKVEFCKTELHFAVETGKVNIIATDEKPPPSNDFRKRRSAFVPIKRNVEKTVTLFGDKVSDFSFSDSTEDTLTNSNVGVNDYDENTAATKSILKNKIPKPKPYLLGENMGFGSEKTSLDNQRLNYERDYGVPTAVSMINKQLHTERHLTTQQQLGTNDCNFTSSSCSDNILRTINDGSPLNITEMKTDREGNYDDSSISRKITNEQNKVYDEVIQSNNTNHIKEKLRELQTSPVNKIRPKTRKLRDHELTYFGIDNGFAKNTNENTKTFIIPVQQSDKYDRELQSVKLIQHIAHSVGNSEAESEDNHEYQNLPIKTNFLPIPTPRVRTKINKNIDSSETYEDGKRVFILNPIVEQKNDDPRNRDRYSRRSRDRIDVSNGSKLRSISEPPKYRLHETIDTSLREHKRKDAVVSRNKSPHSTKKDMDTIRDVEHVEEVTPLYANLNGQHLPIVSEPVIVPKKTYECTELKEKPYRDTGLKSGDGRKSLRSKQKPTSNLPKQHESERSHKIQENLTETSISKDSLNSKTNTNLSHLTQENRSNGSVTRDRVKKEHRRNKSNTRTETTESNKARRKTSREDNKQSKGEDDNTLPPRRDSSAPRAKRESEKEQHIEKNSSSVKTAKKQEEKDLSLKIDKHKRSGYVINYDDKNGTVSSICKVKAGSNKRKKIHPEKTRDSKIKLPERAPLRK